MLIRSAIFALAIGLSSLPAFAGMENQVVGTWRMVSATIDQDGERRPVYGERPNSILIFTQDMHFAAVMTNADTPRFASDARGQGTDDENRSAMANSIGFFGTYTVDETGAFSGNRVEGSTFPNWVGSVRSREQLSLTVEGNRMIERFQRPTGPKIEILWERVE